MEITTLKTIGGKLNIGSCRARTHDFYHLYVQYIYLGFYKKYFAINYIDYFSLHMTGVSLTSGSSFLHEVLSGNLQRIIY